MRALLISLIFACQSDGSDKPGAPPADDSAADDSAPLESVPGESGDTSGALDDTPLWISEVMSDNHGALEDGDGDNPDWVELYNPGPDPVALAGWSLTDSSEQPSTFGAITLLGGEFRVVFASGKGEDGPEGELHTAFKLDNDGETLSLRRPDGSLAHQVDVPALAEDMSWGLSQSVVSEELVGRGSAAALSMSEEEGWTEADFDDSAWTAVILPVGFDGGVAAGSPENAALDKPTEQSTDGYGYTGAQAVDGEPGTFSHTGDGDTSPWLSIDLESDFEISTITLMNRADCCAERLYNVVVEIADADGETLWTSETVNPVAEGVTPTSPGSLVELPVEPPVVGRAVRVSKTAISSTRSEWMSFAEVVVTGTPASPYQSLLETTLDGAPAWLRAPLSVAEAPTRLSLEMAWDDGFQTWLGETLVAEANAGDGLATATHDGATSETFTLDPRALPVGVSALAMLALNSPEDPDDLLLAPTLTASWIETGGPNFFAEPTPGQPNGTGYSGLLAAPEFDPPRGFFEDETPVVIRAGAGATLVYTTDGSAPTPDNGTPVEPADADAAPEITLTLTSTTVLRAAAFLDGWADSAVATHSYLFLSDVIRQPAAPAGWPTVWDGASEAAYTADYEMDPEIVDPDPEAIVTALRSIPTLSVVTDPDNLMGPTGIYENSAERGASWERPASVELILEDGSTGFQEDCGIRIHGYGWRYHSSTLKHSFRLEFSREYGMSKLEYPLFPDAPVDRFDSVVLRAGGSKTWLDFRDPADAQYLHDSFARDTARDMGKLDGHATYVHLYLNGLYWGLYNPVERPEAGFGEEYLGGDDDEYDAINRRTVTNEAVDGTLDAYNTLLALADEDLSTDAGLAAVESMLDLDDLIDYMLIHQYTSNRDGPCCFSHNNMRGVRRRLDGEQFRFFVWDMEYSLWEASDDINVDIDVDGAISHVYARLRDNAEFRARYAERAALHLTGDGALTPDKAAARYEARADEIYEALLAESARWGDTYRSVPYTRDLEWQTEHDRLIDSYFPVRTATLIDQLTAAGLFEP